MWERERECGRESVRESKSVEESDSVEERERGIESVGESKSVRDMGE